MVVLRLPNSARADNCQHDGSDFKTIGRQGGHPERYTGGISGSKKGWLEKATTCRSDANVENRDCFVTPSFHLHRCAGRMPTEISSRATPVTKRYCSGVPQGEIIPYRQAPCQGSYSKIFRQSSCYIHPPKPGRYKELSRDEVRER